LFPLFHLEIPLMNPSDNILYWAMLNVFLAHLLSRNPSPYCLSGVD
jgi:hypothetical protein